MKTVRRVLVLFILVMGVFSLFAEEVTLESDALKLVLHGQNGSFSLYRKTGAKGKTVALNEVTDNSSSTYFALKVGNQNKPLHRSSNVNISVVQNSDKSASLIWESDLMFKAEAVFTLVSTAAADLPADAVRVDFRVMNLSENDTDFAVKAIVDTLLGENSRIHFTTARGTAVRTEKSWTSMVQDKWITSSNGLETVSFLLSGSAATAPESVIASSRDLLLTDVWKPVVNEDRRLTSIQSPNNSAIGIWYKGTKLALFEEVRYTFFMTTAEGGDVPANAALIGIEAEQTAPVLSEDVVQSASEIVDAVVSAEYEVTQPVSLEKEIDYAYIQQLLDYVEVLEKSENPDPEEISKLSAEIDAVILELTK